MNEELKLKLISLGLTEEQVGKLADEGVTSESDMQMLGMANLLVPLTTRLQPSTAAALKRAGLEQKLRGQNPATVQEIVEIAVSEWLEQNSFL